MSREQDDKFQDIDDDLEQASAASIGRTLGVTGMTSRAVVPRGIAINGMLD